MVSQYNLVKKKSIRTLNYLLPLAILFFSTFALVSSQTYAENHALKRHHPHREYSQIFLLDPVVLKFL